MCGCLGGCLSVTAQPMNLPAAPLFAPSVTVIVRDLRLGGLVKSIVGITSIPLHDKIPWYPEYKAPCHQVPRILLRWSTLFHGIIVVSVAMLRSSRHQ